MEKKFDVTTEDIERLMKVFGQLSPCDIWSQVTPEDFTVRRFAMGYVNDIACCELTAEARDRLCRSALDAPAIVVKFSPEHLFYNQARHDVVANNSTISHHGLSPRLTYIDERVTINEYIAGRNYNQEDDLEPETVRQLARILARFHSLRSPVSNAGFHTWNNMMKEMNDNFDKVPGGADVYGAKYLEHIAAEPELKAKYHSVFEDLDLKVVMPEIRDLIEKVRSPLVFNHGDFNRGNRLVRTSPDGAKKEIFLVDFDYSTYNYRGYDLARYFSNYRHVDDMFGDEGHPSDEEMRLFLDEYRAECGKLRGDHWLQHQHNSIQQLTREAKVFLLNALAIDYFFCLMMYTMDPTGPRKDHFLQSAANRYQAYKKAKQSFQDDGTIAFVVENQSGATATTNGTSS